MKYEVALKAAKLLFVLYRLKLITEVQYDKYIDYVTVKSLWHAMKENPSGKSSKDK